MRCEELLDQAAYQSHRLTKLNGGKMAMNGGGAISVFGKKAVPDADDGTVKLQGCIFKNNGARYNGGSIVGINSHVEATNTRFEGNQAMRGGAISLIWSQMNLKNSTFYKNHLRRVSMILSTIGLQAGGGVMFSHGAIPAVMAAHFGESTAEGCTFEENYAVLGGFQHGPAMFVSGSNKDFRITDSVFKSNWQPQDMSWSAWSATRSSAALFMHSGVFRVTRTEFTNNNAFSTDSGDGGKWEIAMTSHELWCQLPYYSKTLSGMQSDQVAIASAGYRPQPTQMQCAKMAEGENSKYYGRMKRHWECSPRSLYCTNTYQFPDDEKAHMKTEHAGNMGSTTKSWPLPCNGYSYVEDGTPAGTPQGTAFWNSSSGVLGTKTSAFDPAAVKCGLAATCNAAGCENDATKNEFSNTLFLPTDPRSNKLRRFMFYNGVTDSGADGFYCPGGGTNFAFATDPMIDSNGRSIDGICNPTTTTPSTCFDLCSASFAELQAATGVDTGVTAAQKSYGFGWGEAGTQKSMLITYTSSWLDGQGGAVNAYGEVSFFFDECTFTGNYGGIGGAFYTSSMAALVARKAGIPSMDTDAGRRTYNIFSRCTFRNNKAGQIAGVAATHPIGTGYSGAFVHFTNGTIMEGNSAVVQAGGVYTNEFGRSNFSEVTATGNSALNVGFLTCTGQCHISKSHLKENSASNAAGALYVQNPVLEQALAFITDTTFESNFAKTAGVLQLSSDGSTEFGQSTATITRSKFISNNASVIAGIEVQSKLIIEDSSFSKNFITKDSLYSAPCIHATTSGSKATIVRCEFDQNYGPGSSGAIAAEAKSQVLIERSQFTNNRAPSGGAILVANAGYDSDTKFDVSNSIFDSNTGTSSPSEGGAVLLKPGSKSSFSGIIFMKNKAGIGAGVVSKGISSFDNCTFTANVATERGGGLVVAPSSAEAELGHTTVVKDSFFNLNEGVDGGGAFFGAHAVITLFKSNTFTGNTGDNGGGVYTHATMSHTENTYTSNTAQLNGGALYLAEGDSTILGNTFTTNKALLNGGAIATSSTAKNLIGQVEPTGISLDPGPTANAANVFEGNSAPIGGCAYFGGINVMNYATGALTSTNCGLKPSMLPFTSVLARQNKAIQANGKSGAAAVFFFESPDKCHADICPLGSCEFCKEATKASCRGTLSNSKIARAEYQNTASGNLQMSSEVLHAAAPLRVPLPTYPGIPNTPRYQVQLKDHFDQIVTDDVYGSGICCTLPAMWPAGSTTPIARAQGKQTECSTAGAVTFLSYGVYDAAVGTKVTYSASCVWRRYDILGKSIPYQTGASKEVTVIDCPRGHMAIMSGDGKRILQCYKCPVGEYLIHGGAAKCEPCIKGGLCRGGDDVVPIEGWWQPPLAKTPVVTATGGRRSLDASSIKKDSEGALVDQDFDHDDTANMRRSSDRRAFAYVKDPKFYECPIKGGCPGGDFKGCQIGYKGIACGVCDDEYVMKGLVCEYCGAGPQADPMVIIVVLILIVVLVGCAISCIESMRQDAIDNQIKDVFDAFDEDGSGMIDIQEMSAALERLSADGNVDRDDIADLFHIIDADSDGLISFEEFYIMMTADSQGETRRRMSLISNAFDIKPKDACKVEERQKPIDEQLNEDKARLQARLMHTHQNVAMNAELAEEVTPDDDDDDDKNFMDDEEDDEEDEEDDEELNEREEDQDPLEDLAAQLKILASHFQVMATFKMSISCNWPPIFGKVCAFFGFLNLDIVGMLGLDCIGHISFYTQLLNYFLLPILAAGALGLCVLAMVLIAEASNDTGEEVDYSQDYSYDPMSFGWKKMMLLLFFIYPGTTQIMLAQFKCLEVEGKHYLEADLSLECYNQDWAFHAVVAGCGVLIYTMGVPLFIYTLLTRNRYKLYSSRKFHARYSFVYVRFESQYYFYELCEMTRKVALGGLVMFIASGTMFQICSAILFAVIFLVMHIKLQPFKQDIDDDIQSVALISTFLTLISAILLRAEEGGAFVTIFVLTINFSTLAFGLWAIIFDTIPSVLEEWQYQYNDAMEALEILKNKFQASAEKAAKDAMRASAAMANAAGDAAGSAVMAGVAVGAAGIATATGSSSEGGISKAHFLETSDTLFARYDLDGSETLNSNEELEQLTYNLAFKLKLGIETDSMDKILGTVELSNDNAWNLAEFQDWFLAKIMDGAELQ